MNSQGADLKRPKPGTRSSAEWPKISAKKTLSSLRPACASPVKTLRVLRAPAMRIQLSMYVPQTASALLEEVCQLLDPIQASLIPAHVTLCSVKKQAPHITLAHPRNPKASCNIAANAVKLPGNLSFTFESVNRIQQVGSQPWQVLEQVRLSPAFAATPSPSFERMRSGQPASASHVKL